MQRDELVDVLKVLENEGLIRSEWDARGILRYVPLPRARENDPLSGDPRQEHTH